jgi:hypothetical protein
MRWIKTQNHPGLSRKDLEDKTVERNISFLGCFFDLDRVFSRSPTPQDPEIPE